jgi:hypothetical protein
MTRPSQKTLVTLFAGLLLIAIPTAYLHGERKEFDFQMSLKPHLPPPPGAVSFDLSGALDWGIYSWMNCCTLLGFCCLVAAAGLYLRDHSKWKRSLARLVAAAKDGEPSQGQD